MFLSLSCTAFNANAFIEKDLAKALALSKKIIRARRGLIEWSDISTKERDLSGTDLSGADLSQANLSNTNFYGASMIRINLSWANLENANLCYANLSNACLMGTILNGTNFSKANLMEADFTRSTLRLQSILSGTNLNGVTGICQREITYAQQQGAKNVPTWDFYSN